MYKKICFTIIIVLLCLSLSSCSFIINDVLGIGYTLSLDDDMHIKFDPIDDESFEYQGHIYYLSPRIFLYNECVGDDYEYIGWSGSKWWPSEIWGDSAESPTFLYSRESRQTYFREDYNYRTDTFSISGTDDAICFGEDLLSTDYKNTNLFNRESIDIEISSIKCPVLTTTLFVVHDSGRWYAITHSQIPFELSDNFIEILKSNGFIK